MGRPSPAPRPRGADPDAATCDDLEAYADRPVTRGLYRVSRHPQIVMTSIILLGACIAIGSWLALLTLVIARAFGHLGILAEEQVCLQQYGEAYRIYMQEVPRYLVLF